MKKTAIFILTAGLVGLLTACYEDKGNYDYTDVNELKPIELEEGSTLPLDFRLSMGESIEIHPVIKFVNGTGDMNRLEYKWELIRDLDNEEDIYTQPGWNTLDFSWTPDFLISRGRLLLTVTDPVTGLQTFAYASVSVTSRYNAYGAMVLSEKDGKTMFSFIKATETDITIPTKVEVFEDVYFMENNEDLPAEPIKMHEHYCVDKSTAGQILVMTENGAIDVDGLDFRRDIDLEEAFDGGTYPEGFGYVRDAMFMRRIDLVMDAEGHVYSRLKNTAELFHSGYFLPNQLTVEGEEEPLVDCYPIVAPFSNFSACLLFDGAKRRFILVGDTGTGGWGNPEEQNAGRAIVLKNPSTTPEGTPDLYQSLEGMDEDAEILSIDHFNNGDYYSGGMGYSIVFHKEGKTCFQEFTIEKEYGLFGFTAVDPAVYEITGLPGKPTFAYAQSYYKGGTYTNNPLLFLAVGSELYVYDRSNPTLPVKRYEPRTPEGELISNAFSADIVAMDGENYGGRWAVVGLADGRVLILKTQRADYADEQIAYYDSGDYSYGEIKQVLCKTGGANGWQPSY